MLLGGGIEMFGQESVFATTLPKKAAARFVGLIDSLIMI